MSRRIKDDFKPLNPCQEVGIDRHCVDVDGGNDGNVRVVDRNFYLRLVSVALFPQFRNSTVQPSGAPMDLSELRRDIKKGNFWIPKNFNPNGDHNESH